MVVDRDPALPAQLEALLGRKEISVEAAGTGAAALELFDAAQPDAVVSEARMADDGALKMLEVIHARDPDLPVLVTTSLKDVQTALRMLRHGATDCLTKPVDADAWSEAIHRALRARALHDSGSKAARLRAQLGLGLGSLVGSSPAMARVYQQLERVAVSRATVLVGGETGTGKGEVARVIHQLSGRSGAFVTVHCASLAPSLLESELFGHEKGAFTGADRRRPGRFEMARNGTLFLDEIGEMHPALQVKLLHVLQHKTFVRVGGEEELGVDFRLVTATHRTLSEEVEAGRFREDLYYRLNVVQIDIPPLRERGADIGLLSRFLLQRHAVANDKLIGELTDGVLEKLSSHDWPGNVRELDNAIERAVVMCPGGWLGTEHFDLDSGKNTGPPPIPGSSMAEIKRYAILATLQASRGSIPRAAEVLGLSERTIQQRLRSWGLARPRGRPRKHGKYAA
jgi:two-component system response regulator HydG